MCWVALDIDGFLFFFPLAELLPKCLKIVKLWGKL